MANEQNLKHFHRQDNTNEPLAAKPTQVRLPERVEQSVNRLPNKAAWLRRVIAEALEREGLLQPDDSN
ncbi:MAG: hypothetical protein JOZ78_10080 [Chroococcidiopsidaceae cyanobacterium CP_BM_ER_R8_30]|nr:hypothetical protein [Chroococcidiopsidaceae cyanobacterium CP_BM_ER_R8_30]